MTLRQRCCRGRLPTNPVVRHKQNSLATCHSIVSDNPMAVRRGLGFLRNGAAKHVCLRHLAFDRNSGFEWNLGCMKKIATRSALPRNRIRLDNRRSVKRGMNG
jgi:hypothetical protein